MKSVRSKPETKKEKPEGPWKKRILYGALGCSIGAAILWLIAMSINYWVFWSFPPGVTFYRSSTKAFVEKQYGGMWQICRRERNNETSETHEYCSGFDFSPSSEELQQDPETDSSELMYRRAVIAVAIIAVFLTVVADAFTWYAITHPRYIFKRLAGCLLIGCAALLLVCIESFQSMIHYEKDHLPARYPPKATHSFGFCFAVAWICFVVFLAAGIILLVNSRKQKDSKEHDDNPVIIGRV